MNSRKLDFDLVGVIPPYGPFTKEYNVQAQRIFAVAGDRGGWDAIEPPLRKAAAIDCEVHVFFAGTCAKQVAEGKLQLAPGMRLASEPLQLLMEIRHDLTVIAASQSEEGAAAASVAILNSHAPILAVQDTYGSLHPALQLARQALPKKYRPIDCVCVTDDFSRSLLNHAHNVYPWQDPVVITGGPQFDKTVEIKKNWASLRNDLRQQWGVNGEELLFLIAGQLNGTAEALILVEEAIRLREHKQRESHVHVMVRPHSRSTWLDKALLGLSNCWATNNLRCVDEMPPGTHSSEDLLPAADFILSGYSTTNYYGILYGMPGVIYVGTPSFKWDLWQEKKLERPPEVEAGAGWYVQTPKELADVITSVRLGPAVPDVLKIVSAQQRIAQYNDGHATDRVWEEMRKLLTV